MHVRHGVGNECRGESNANDLNGGEVFGFRVSAGAAITIRFFEAVRIFVGLVNLAGDRLGNFVEVQEGDMEESMLKGLKDTDR